MTELRTSLVDAFQRYFEIVSAETPALQRAAQEIRFQVYCRELRYEAAEGFPDGCETDGYDRQSKHCLLRHRPSGSFAGCVRLVLNDLSDPQGLLPFEHHCGQSLDRGIVDTRRLPKGSFGEISRLAVVSRFRRRAGEQSSAHGVGEEAPETTPDERRIFPHIAVGLYLAAAALGLREGLNRVFVMMEPRLARHMRRYGIVFTQAGNVIDYHGQRGPFFITREDLYSHLQPEVRGLLELIYGKVCGQDVRLGDRE